MKITRKQLRQIIKEEASIISEQQDLIKEAPQVVQDLANLLKENGYSAKVFGLERGQPEDWKKTEIPIDKAWVGISKIDEDGKKWAAEIELRKES
jgi:hypothetical protein